jgi:hypothetical protein
MVCVEFALQHQRGLVHEAGCLRKTSRWEQSRGAFVSATSERALQGGDEGVQFEIGQQLHGYFAVGLVRQEEKDTPHTPGTMVLGVGVNQRGEIWASEEGNRSSIFVARGKPGDKVAIQLTVDGAAFLLNGEVQKELQGVFEEELYVKVVADWNCGKNSCGRLPVRNINWLVQEPNMVVTVHGQSSLGENEEAPCVVRCLTMGGSELATFHLPADQCVEQLTLELAQLVKLPAQRVKLVAKDGRLLQPMDTVNAIL